MSNAQRFGSFLWGLICVVLICLWPVSPPTAGIGEAGWGIAATLSVAAGSIAIAMRAGLIASWKAMLVVPYVTVAGIAMMQLLSGGSDAPYANLMLLMVGFVAALHTPRQTLEFLGIVLSLLLVPIIVFGWHQSAAASLVSFVVWVPLSFMVNRLMAGVRSQRLLHALEEATAREEARRDSLTGLPNRRAFDEAIGHELLRASRHGMSVALVMLDIEDFKAINDDYGMSEGDRCLRCVAETISSTVRAPDQCFRWGGDEFALLLVDQSRGAANAVSGRLKLAVERSCTRPDGTPLGVRWVTGDSKDYGSPEALVKRVGLDMTAAKAVPGLRVA